MKSLLMVLFFSIRCIFAQDSTNNHYIELYSGKKIFDKTVFYKEDRICADTACFFSWQVKLFHNEFGFFINTLPVSNKNIFGQRVVQGNIDLYKTVTFNKKLLVIKGNDYNQRLDYYNLKSSYNIDYVELKETSINNLKKDLKNNTQSTKFLNGAKTTIIIASVIEVGGLAMIIYGLAAPSSVNNTSEDILKLGDSLVRMAFVSTGLLTVTASIILSSVIKKNAKKRAVITYNE